MLKRTRSDLLILLILFALPLFFFFQQTIGGKTLIPSENLYQYEPYATYRPDVPIPHNHLLSDLVLQSYQWKHFTRQQLAQGEIPLWNPYLLGGIPFLAAGQHSALYPLSVLYYVLDLWAAYGWFTVINLWLAGAFTYGFIRALGIGRAGSLLGAIVYQLNGFLLSSVVFQMMMGSVAWLPLILWMSERIVAGRGRVVLNVSIGAVALGMNVLVGHAEITIYTLLIAGYYAFLRLVSVAWQARSWQLFFARGVLWSSMVVLGLGLGAIQLLPLFEFVQTNWRAERSSLETVRGYAHPLRDIVQFLLPNFYGNPSHHTIFDLFSGEVVTLTSPQPHTEWGIKNYVEGALYMGVLPLFLAFVGLLPSKRAFESRWIWGSLGALALSFMFGLPTYALVYVLPGINQLNSPFRWIYALVMCVAVLSAFGLDTLTVRLSAKTLRRWSMAFLAMGGSLLGGLIVIRLFWEATQPLVLFVFKTMTNAQSAFANEALFFSYQAFNGAILVGIMVGVAGVLWWAGRSTRLPDDHPHGIMRWQVVAVVLVTVDLMVASWGFNPASDPALLTEAPPQIALLQALRDEMGGAVRVMTLDNPSQRLIFQANSLMQYGIEDIRGYDSIIPKPYVDYMRELAPQVQLGYNRIAPLYTRYPDSTPFNAQQALNGYRLRYLGVDVVFTPANVDLSAVEGVSELNEWATTGLRAWQLRDSFPEAYLCCENSPTIEALLTTGSVIPDEQGRAFYEAIQAEDSVTFISDSGREKFYEVTVSEGFTWFIVTENYSEGWRAFVKPLGAGDDQETAYDVVMVNGIFQGVKLPVGAWQVRLVYSPSSFQVGLFASVISISVIMLMLGMWFWREFVGVNNDSSSQGARVARNSLAPILLNLFNRGIDFAFLLVMLRLLSPEAVGTYNYLVVLFVWFDTFTNFGLNLFLIREISRDRTHAPRLFYQSSLLRLFLVIVGVALVVGYVVIRQSTVTPALEGTALLTLGLLYVGLFPSNLSQGFSALFYAHEQAEKPSAIQTITTINKAVFGVVVLLMGGGIVGLALVSIFNNVVTLGVFAWSGRGLLRGLRLERPDFALIRQMIRNSWALLLNNFLAIIFFQVDIILLEAIKGAGVVARYSIAYKWLLAINVVPSFFTQALLPVMSRQAQENREAFIKTYGLGLKLLFALSIPLAVVFTVLAEFLTQFMGGAQYLPDGAIAIQVMIWSIPFGWMNSLTQYALIALDLQKRITVAFAVAVTFNIVSNMIFIPSFSFVAAAITTILSEAVLFVFFAQLMQIGTAQSLPWVSWLWRPVIAGGGMLILVGISAPFSLWGALLLGVIGYSVVFVALRPLNTEEQMMFGRLLPHRIKPLAVRWGLAV